MAETSDGAERRPGCSAGRLLGAVARLILVYPLVSIASHVGQQAQRALWPEPGAPYEGALAGILLGLVVGLALWGKAISEARWRSRLAEATLATVALVWLVGLLVVHGRPVAATDLLVPWAVCLVGAAGIAALLRA
jgi:hypothetical protein